MSLLHLRGMVDEFPYLGSLIDSSGRIAVDVERRVAQASRAFGALMKAVFYYKHLKLATRRKIYNACVLSVLLYGAECWVLLRKQEKKLNTFHHRCIRSILGITNMQQWSECILMTEVRKRWGDEETAADKVKKKRLEWLGHLARMPDYRVPKSALFSWFLKPYPRCGPKKRWRDMMRNAFHPALDLTALSYHLSSGTPMYHDGMERCRESQGLVVRAAVTARDVVCMVCSRKFRRESDKARHKCVD